MAHHFIGEVEAQLGALGRGAAAWLVNPCQGDSIAITGQQGWHKLKHSRYHRDVGF